MSTPTNATFGTFADGGSVTTGDIVVGLRGGVNTRFSYAAAPLLVTLTDAHLFVGNASNIATDIAMSGDATMANTGALTLANTAVTAATYTVNGSALFTVDAKGRLTSASDITVGSAPTGAAGGDLGGTYPSPTVAKLQGHAVKNVLPTDAQVLIWNNTNTDWEPVSMSGDATIANGGALTLANTAVVAGTYTVNGVNLLTVDSKGRLTTASNITVTAAPSGAAGGDLSSNYPNPTVAKINGVALGVTTATAGNLLIGSGTDWVSNVMSGDGTLSAAGALVVTKTNGVVFAASATTDATNASNISSGALALARLGSAYTDGQLLIGSTATGNLSAATLTAGTNITITNAAGGITIAASGGGTGTTTISDIMLLMGG